MGAGRKSGSTHTVGIPALAYILKKLLLSKTGPKKQKPKRVPEALPISSEIICYKGRPFSEY